MSNKKVHIFYHVAAINDYKIIVKEQLTEIRKSNILSLADLTIGVVGVNTLEQSLTDDIHYFESLDRYEYPTLHLMWEWCKQNPNTYVLYIHTKSVSANKNEHLKHIWRYEMMANVRNWKKCIEVLKEGYSMVASGTKWEANAGGEKFWAGSFFWASSNFIAKLPDPEIIPERFGNTRWYSELWPSINIKDFSVFEIKKTLIEKLAYSVRLYSNVLKYKFFR